MREQTCAGEPENGGNAALRKMNNGDLQREVIEK